MSDINDAIQTVTKTFTEVANAYGPAVKDAVLGVTRLDGANDVLHSGLYLVWAVGVAYGLAKMWRWFIREEDEDNLSPCMVATFIGVLGGGIPLLVGLGVLFDVWTWAKIFYPTLYLVHHALTAVAGK